MELLFKGRRGWIGAPVGGTACGCAGLVVVEGEFSTGKVMEHHSETVDGVVRVGDFCDAAKGKMDSTNRTCREE